VDLPAEFIHELQGIDEHFYPVWHPHQMLWDSIINEYSGNLEDPRFEIHYKHSELNFGFVLTDGSGAPLPDGEWHIWRLCRPHGWAHIIKVESKERSYCNLLAKRLWLQAQYNDRYGHTGYSRMLEEMQLADRQKAQDDKQDLMNEIQKTNSSMLNRVAQNFESGRTKPTNPTKEIITSYPGQTNKSKIIRPLDDKEGGLILPDEW
jgi:hypothetical protein